MVTLLVDHDHHAYAGSRITNCDSVEVDCSLLCLYPGFTYGSYATALSVAVPLLALLGALSLTAEIVFAFIRYCVVCTLC